MAGFGKQRILGRVVLLLILIFAMALGGVFWFDYLGLIDAKGLFAPALRLAGLPTRTGNALPPELPALLDEERYAKQLEAIEALRQEIDARSMALSERQATIEAMALEIEDRQKALDEREKSFNSAVERYDNRRANIEQNARYLGGMPPQDAVAILAELDDQIAIDILRAVEELAARSGEASVVAFWLSLLPPARAADLQRKMAAKPNSLD